MRAKATYITDRFTSRIHKTLSDTDAALVCRWRSTEIRLCRRPQPRFRRL